MQKKTGGIAACFFVNPNKNSNFATIYKIHFQTMQKMFFRICVCIACISITALTADMIYASVKKQQPQKEQNTTSIYDFVVKDADSADYAFSQLKDKIVLIVNTATKCGFTPQYEGLQALYDKYKTQGFEIIDFPCNQFMQQAPGTNAQIREFCQTTYKTTFPQMAKIDVNGENTHPLYVYLKSCQGDNKDIRWNFEKFLINRKGEVVERFSTRTKPEEIEQRIQQLLQE